MKVYTTQGAAEFMKVSQRYIRQIITEKRLKATRIGQIWMIEERNLIKFEKERQR